MARYATPRHATPRHATPRHVDTHLHACVRTDTLQDDEYLLSKVGDSVVSVNLTPDGHGIV